MDKVPKFQCKMGSCSKVMNKNVVGKILKCCRVIQYKCCRVIQYKCCRVLIQCKCCRVIQYKCCRVIQYKCCSNEWRRRMILKHIRESL